MTDDPIDRLRSHVEKHKHREQAFFSTAGLQVLFEELDRLRKQITVKDAALLELLPVRDRMEWLRAQVEKLSDDKCLLIAQRDELRFQIEHLEACVTIHDRNRKELKAQVERLIAKEGKRIQVALEAKP